ncbi:translation initiation factor IF-2-like isoform X2 [Passer montanus]|uniref:translation initiation factor IF-2-like isoform X2 n=1 Tax=Passer montanus TaxID=9160 RepID=UPI001961EEA3|nr:translation initiation factor IF-2-like isoform X2 [Passer montanus]
MMLRLGATAARGCLSEPPEPREPEHIWNTAAAAGSSPDPAKAPTAMAQPWSQPFPSGPGGARRGRPAARERAGRQGPAASGQSHCLLARHQSLAWGRCGVVPFFHCSRGAAASAMGFRCPCIGMQRQQGVGGHAAASSRSSEGTRVSAFPSKRRHLSNVISEVKLLSRESVAQDAEHSHRPAAAEHSPPPPREAAAPALAPLPASVPVSAPGPARPGHAAAPGWGPGSQGQWSRPPRPQPVLGLSPVVRGRGRDRGDWGDARLRAELKAPLVSLSVPVSVRGDKTAPPASALYTGVRSGGSSERRD